MGTISDAVGTARKHSAGTGSATRTAIYGRRGIGIVFRPPGTSGK